MISRIINDFPNTNKFKNIKETYLSLQNNLKIFIEKKAFGINKLLKKLK